MDIINPKIIVINKRYYRSNKIVQTPSITENGTNYPNENLEDFCDYDEGISKFDIFEDGADFICNLSVASMFYGFIIGKRGESKKRIELDTKTTITIPTHGTLGKIIVKGHNYALVDRALSRIMDLVEYGRQNLPFTHFFSIPANNEQIMKQFELFKSQVLHSCLGDRGVSEKLFQKPFKLHLTLSMLVLGDHAEIDQLISIFHEFKMENEDLFRRPLKVHIKGIENMNDDPCEVRVLYGKVDKSLDWEKLQILGDKLSDFLVQKQLITRKEFNSVTLHMTVLNVSFLSQQDLALDTADSVHNPSTYDCSNIIRKFADWDFGVLDISEICLSKRYGGAGDCYYNSAATFQFGC